MKVMECCLRQHQVNMSKQTTFKTYVSVILHTNSLNRVPIHQRNFSSAQSAQIWLYLMDRICFPHVKFNIFSVPDWVIGSGSLVPISSAHHDFVKLKLTFLPYITRYCVYINFVLYVLHYIYISISYVYI